MELRPPSGPVPQMFRPVRERHPDADVVLVAPAEPPADGGPDGAGAGTPGSGEADLAADHDAVSRTLGTVAAVATGAEPDSEARTAFGPREDTVLARGRHVAVLAQSPLAGLTTYLSGDGWALARPASDHEVVLARRGGLEVAASYAATTGVLSLTVASPPRSVGVARARELVGS